MNRKEYLKRRKEIINKFTGVAYDREIAKLEREYQDSVIKKLSRNEQALKLIKKEREK